MDGFVLAHSRDPGQADGLAALGWELRRSGVVTVAQQRRGARPAHRTLAVLHGSIFNAAALAAELGLPEAIATEAVLAHGYGRWGDDLLGRLRGEFAVAIWDPVAGRGVVARDHLGARGVYVHDDGRRLLLATELAPLLAVLARRPGPDAVSVANWLSSNPLAPGSTFYEGIDRLPPAGYVSLTGDGATRRRYWRPAYAPPLELSPDELVAQVRERTIAAVGARIPQHERVGVLLSGGLDSSSIAALGCRALEPGRRLVAGYSATFPGRRGLDESAWIDHLTEEVGLPGVRMAVDGGGMLAAAVVWARTWQVPVMGANFAFEQPLLARARRDGIDALLDGEGGDEVFGARHYLLADRLLRGRALGAARLAARLPGVGEQPSRRHVLGIARELAVKGAVPYGVHRWRRRRRGPAVYAPAWMTPEGARRAFDASDEWAWKRLDGPRWWAFQAYVLSEGIEAVGIFDHLRRRAAGAGLEERHPLLDLDLVAFALRLPPELTFDPVHSRALFRRAVAGLVPERHLQRVGKSHFDGLVCDSLLADLPAARRLLAGPESESSAYVDRAVVERLLLDGPDAHPRGASAWGNELWRLLALECWLRTQADPSWGDELLERGVRGRIHAVAPGGAELPQPDFSHLDHHQAQG